MPGCAANPLRNALQVSFHFVSSSLRKTPSGWLFLCAATTIVGNNFILLTVPLASDQTSHSPLKCSPLVAGFSFLPPSWRCCVWVHLSAVTAQTSALGDFEALFSCSLLCILRHKSLLQGSEQCCCGTAFCGAAGWPCLAAVTSDCTDLYPPVYFIPYISLLPLSFCC